ncbi:MAG: NAD(P)H-hydrate dehydratase [Candidatus Accumulibacter sp.]|jgi:hydroxyethylthiazole kinase-like uncharacterized protein yjeF|nr:NAD(P)H-hydrate dehydratase [Accumulibacter sp.]
MIPLYRSGELRKIESLASTHPLMERAGAAAAELAAQLADTRGAAILILAGPGNNGGDAFVAARRLREGFFDVRVVFIGSPDNLPEDAADAFRRFVGAGGVCLSEIPEKLRWSLIVDGVFGIGLKREISGAYADLIHRANALARRDACPLLALDCPSGLDADTGAQRGATIAATHTISFIAHKPGLFTLDGPDRCGRVSLAPLGLDSASLVAPSGELVAPEGFSAHLKPRLHNTHKGNYGSVGVLGGNDGMVGAAWLAARAALKLGAGRVYLGLLAENAHAIDPLQPELMLRAPDDLLKLPLDALACGPGFGVQVGEDLLARASSLELPLVLDADALNLLAQSAELQKRVARRAAPTILTPHPTEAARLLGRDTAEIQSDRVFAALELAKRFNAHVALKGCGTLIASEEKWFVNTSGNAGLSTAGSGDTLTGFVGALIAQRWPPREALLCAVHLHGAAADRLAAEGKGPIGLMASELADSARAIFNEWVSGIRDQESGDRGQRTERPSASVVRHL